MRSFVMLSILCVLVGYTTAIDECGQYYTCRDCLNITAGASTGHRDNCGWCHFPIKYRNGTDKGIGTYNLGVISEKCNRFL